MPALTRRRDPKARRESWIVIYGNVCVGTIGLRAGVPTHVEQWGWRCGFPQVNDRGLRTQGTAATFEEARADFEAAWSAYLPRCTEADFEAYRRQQAWTHWKYQMHETGCRLPTQVTELRSRCFCGAEIGPACEEHVYASHMEAA
jgi:hypothetical protein